MDSHALVLEDATYCNRRLFGVDAVLVRFCDDWAGGGITPIGLEVAHSKGLPAIFGEVCALGPDAKAAGLSKGQSILFTRYAGEVTDVLDDGQVYAIFDYNDIRAEYRL